MGCTLSTDKSKPVGAPVKKCIPLKLVQQICEIIKANAAFIPVLSRINDEELDLMVQCMERRTINSGDVVHKQGCTKYYFYEIDKFIYFLSFNRFSIRFIFHRLFWWIGNANGGFCADWKNLSWRVCWRNRILVQRPVRRHLLCIKEINNMWVKPWR